MTPLKIGMIFALAIILFSLLPLVQLAWSAVITPNPYYTCEVRVQELEAILAVKNAEIASLRYSMELPGVE